MDHPNGWPSHNSERATTPRSIEHDPTSYRCDGLLVASEFTSQTSQSVTCEEVIVIEE
jgi:hypothetical protein